MKVVLNPLHSEELQFATNKASEIIDLTATLDLRYLVKAGISGGQTAIGGTAITDILKLQGTSGNGTLTSPAIQALVGNNGATTALTILNNGNVGIGTTSPGAKLEVDAGGFGGTIANLTTSHSNGYLTLTANTRTVRFGADGGIGPHFGSVTTGGLAFLDAHQMIPLSGLAVSDGTEDIGRSDIRWGTLYALQGEFSGTGDNYFTGNVGIGTQAPLSKLGVLGNLSVGGTYGSLAAPTGGMIIEGNVGIGTTGPRAGSKLDVIGGVLLGDSVSGDILDARTILGGSTYLKTRGLGHLHFFVGGAGIYPMIIHDSGGIAIGSTYSRTDPGVNDVIIEGNVGIGTTVPGSKLSVNGGISAGTYYGTAAPSNGFIISGNVGIGVTDPDTKLEVLGATGLKISFDATDNTTLVTDTNGILTITPSGNGIMVPTTKQLQFNDSSTYFVYSGGDLDLYTAANKTLELQTVVWKDRNVGAAQLSRPAASQPDEDDFLTEAGAETGITTLAYAVGEKASGSFEMQHDYKEGSDFTFHIHWQGITDPDGAKKVQWRITYVFMRDDTTLDAVTTVDSADTTIDTQYKCYRTDVVVVTGATSGNNGSAVKIGDQFLFTIERVASTGDAYAGDALVATMGIHYQCDTFGSREIIDK